MIMKNKFWCKYTDYSSFSVLFYYISKCSIFLSMIREEEIFERNIQGVEIDGEKCM